MPLFEYVCRDCDKQFTFLAGVISDNTDARCPRCGSARLQKLISRVARGRSDDERMELVAERMENQNLDDPAALRRFAREMGREISAETGENITDETEDMIEAETSGRAGAKSGGGDDGTIY